MKRQTLVKINISSMFCFPLLPKSSSILSPILGPNSKPVRPPPIFRADSTISRLSLIVWPEKFVTNRSEKLKIPLEDATMTMITQRATGARTALFITVIRTPLAPVDLSRQSAS